MKLWLAMCLLLTVACNGRSDAPPAFSYPTKALWAERPASAQAQVNETITWALRYWGGSEDDLRGWRFTFVDGQVLGEHAGYTSFDSYTVEVQASGLLFDCVAWSALAHEIGHVVLTSTAFPEGDPHHSDPRWARFDAAQSAWALEASCTPRE